MSHPRQHTHSRRSNVTAGLTTEGVKRKDLLDLAEHLRQEKLFVQHEKNQLKDLNEKVKKVSENLSHTAWIAHQQRENLDRLTFSGRGSDTNPSYACLRANLLEQTVFKDAYKELNYQETLYSDFVRSIRSRPQFLSYCLAAGDKLNLPEVIDIMSILFGGIYGSCLMADDEQLVLRLLHHLMRSQLTSASNPRKLLRQKNCAFTRLYKLFSEELFSAKLFLTSALYEPILSLLSDDEIFLDIDPSKTAIRFAPSERLRKFGKDGTPEYDEKLKRHRVFIVDKLVKLTSNFIRGIKENLHCFPPSLARLLRAMYSLLMSSGKAETKEVHAVCVDAIFTLFICPALVDPNPVGIIDTPISYIARSNLMQVAQILQVLAMGKLEDATIESNPAHDLYSKFEREVVSSLLEAMLESAKDLAAADVNKHPANHDGNKLNTCEDLADLLMVNDPAFVEEIGDSTKNRSYALETPSSRPHGSSNPGHGDLEGNQSVFGQDFSRLSVLMTHQQLETLINFFRSLYRVLSSRVEIDDLPKDVGNGIDMTELESLISMLPESIPGSKSLSKINSPTKSLKTSNSNSDLNGVSGGKGKNAASSLKSEDKLVALAQAKKQQLTSKLSTVIKQAGNVSSIATGSRSNSANISPSISSSSLSAEGNIGNNGNLNGQDKYRDNLKENGLDLDVNNDNKLSSNKSHNEPETVLVIPLNDVNEGSAKPPGFLSEEHVLEKSRAQCNLKDRNLVTTNGPNTVSGSGGRVVRMNLPGHDLNLPEGRESSNPIEVTSTVHVGGGRMSNPGDGTPSSVGEKRTRFSLTHDDGSIGNTSDNLEAISEAASNHSVASSLEDEVDRDNVDPDDPLQIIDNLSDMVSANVSGRGTPNVSGRDTPSSQVTEGDEIVGGVGAGGGSEVGEATSTAGAESGVGVGSGSETEGMSVVIDDRPNAIVGNVSSADDETQDDGTIRRVSLGGAAPLRGSGTSRGGARDRGGKNRSSLPKGKNGEPDLEEKFGRFEIKPQGTRTTILGPTSVGSVGGCVGSEHGDETVSMISDTWSTDVLASDTESYYNVASNSNGNIGGVEELLLHRRPGAVDIGDHGALTTSSSRINSAGAISNSSIRQTGIATSTSQASSLSAGIQTTSGPFANLLDIAETASEAWSIDVLASDTESLRLGELDNEDSMSVARSDDTRFTDDTTRSDPDQILDIVGNMSGNFTVGGTRRRDENKLIKGASSQPGPSICLPTSNVSENNLLRPSRAAAVEQWARQSSAGNRLASNMSSRRGSDNSAGSTRNNDTTGSILKKSGSLMASGGSSAGSSREHPSSTDAEDVVSDLIDHSPAVQQMNSADTVNISESNIPSELSSGVVTVTRTVNKASSSEKTNIDLKAAKAQPAQGEANHQFLSNMSSNANPTNINQSGRSASNDSNGNEYSLLNNEHHNECELGNDSSKILESSIGNSSPNVNFEMEAGTHNEASTEARVNVPTMATGAIPKSISFDTAQNHSSINTKTARDKSFFPKSWKLPKIGRNRGGHGGSGKFKPDDMRGSSRGGNEGAHNKDLRTDNLSYGQNSSDNHRESLFQRLPSDEASSASDGTGQMNMETSDDILEKYRTKGRSQPSSNNLELSNSNEIILGEQRRNDNQLSVDNSDSVFQDRLNVGNNDSLSMEDDEDIESASTAARRIRSVEDTYAFQDAKRKLRLMLAEADISLLSTLPPRRTQPSLSNGIDHIPKGMVNGNENGSRDLVQNGNSEIFCKENDLIWFLRVQLAEALNLQDRNLVARLYETLRCIQTFDKYDDYGDEIDNEGNYDVCTRLIRSLQDDYRCRSPYLSYLVRCRQGLASALAQQERHLSRCAVDRKVCSAYLVSVCIRQFLEQRQQQLDHFVAQFKNANAADEKTALMETFLESLWSQLEKCDGSMVWALSTSEEQLNLCRLTVERAVVGQIFVHAMYPNGEADISRDDVFTQNIRQLAREITPGHRLLKIPRHFRYEAPWPSAQAEIRRLAAYKTPADKVSCVTRCCQTIMNLLSMASGGKSGSVPAADDFVPVMVFVVIKANPPSLLSTVQYVDSFYGNRMAGEDQYWWMQFAAAIEFIKTMLQE